ncbi:MAG: hypothetical protein VKK97_03150 [Synechococcaceae cyanobacterium]|nr:hypothetical protein [Synechococcaceae cyanobacterium]
MTDDALLQRARAVALRQNTTVNAPVGEFLGHFIDARSRRLAPLAQFEAVAAGSSSASSTPWNRGSLNDR